MAAAFPAERYLWDMYALTPVCNDTPSHLFKEGALAERDLTALTMLAVSLGKAEKQTGWQEHRGTDLEVGDEILREKYPPYLQYWDKVVTAGVFFKDE